MNFSPIKRFFSSAFDASEEILDDDPAVDECMPHKRARRLTLQQVRALEKAFDVDNKLEPRRKAQLSKQVGLEDRQVAVWFQNRRARWKTKQLERDYNSLKKQLEALIADRDKVFKEKEALEAQVIKLKSDLYSKEIAATPETRKNRRTEIYSKLPSVQVRECEKTLLTSCSDHKEKEVSSITDESDGSAIENLESPISTIQNTASALGMPLNMIYPGDMIMQSETMGLQLELSDQYYGRTVYGQRVAKGEEMLFEEVESCNEFVPVDWWETS